VTSTQNFNSVGTPFGRGAALGPFYLLVRVFNQEGVRRTSAMEAETEESAGDLRLVNEMRFWRW